MPEDVNAASRRDSRADKAPLAPFDAQPHIAPEPGEVPEEDRPVPERQLFENVEDLVTGEHESIIDRDRQGADICGPGAV